jgi:PAS domain-containing protein
MPSKVHGKIYLRISVNTMFNLYNDQEKNRYILRLGVSWDMALKLKIVKRIKVKNPNYSLHRSLEKLQNIYRHTKWGMCLGSLEGTIQMANPAFAEMHGYSQEEIIGIDVAELFAEEERALLPEITVKIHREGN